jgi:hypothetical protein
MGAVSQTNQGAAAEARRAEWLARGRATPRRNGPARLSSRVVQFAVSWALETATKVERLAACPPSLRPPGPDWVFRNLVSQKLRSLMPWANPRSLENAVRRAIPRLEAAGVVEVLRVPVRGGYPRARWVRLIDPAAGQQRRHLVRALCMRCCLKRPGHCPGCGEALERSP